MCIRDRGIQRQNGALVVHVLRKDFRNLQPLAEKTGVELTVEGQFGFPFLGYRYRKRWGLLAGVLLFFTFLWGMSQFVWKIEVVGNERVKTQDVLQIAEQYGLKTGVLRNKVNTYTIERNLIIQIDQLSWAAVNLNGTHATIEVDERINPCLLYTSRCV